jgi:hypothetical protein
MNTRSYMVKLSDSDLDFRAEKDQLVQSTLSYQSEPFLINGILVLDITNSYIHTDYYTKKGHEVLKVQTVYEIPASKITSRQDIYEFYEDSVRNLNETYQTHRLTLPDLPKIEFPPPPIENYKGEIDRVFALLDSRN